MIAGIEAGGTKFVCAIGPAAGSVLRQITLPTRGPEETLGEAIAFFRHATSEFGTIAGVGIGSFGPLELDPSAAEYGAVLQTPKPGWSGVRLRARLAEALDCAVGIDTDVNASGIAEAAMGAGRGWRSVAYVTIGTGIGGGLILDGRPLHGLSHPEMGHVRVRRHRLDDFPGLCPFHGDCLEGLASGPAIQARTGQDLAQAAEDAPIRTILADYLGQFCATLTLLASPQVIILGGGVMDQNPGLFDGVRAAAQASLGGYLQANAVGAGVDRYIVPPGLGAASGLMGAMMIGAAAMQAAKR